MKVKVTGGWSLGIEDKPERYTDGEIFDAPDELAAQLIANGQAVAVKAVADSQNKAVASGETPNKALKAPKITKTVKKVARRR